MTPCNSNPFCATGCLFLLPLGLLLALALWWAAKTFFKLSKLPSPKDNLNPPAAGSRLSHGEAATVNQCQNGQSSTGQNAEPTEAELALIVAAAVNTLLEGREFRIISIRPAASSAWVEEGRCEIFRSKNIL